MIKKDKSLLCDAILDGDKSKFFKKMSDLFEERLEHKIWQVYNLIEEEISSKNSKRLK